MRARKLTMDTSSIDELFILLIKSWRTYYVTLQIWCVFRSANILRTSEMTMWLPKKFNNFVIKNNTMLLSNFMWLRMSNKCEISCKNSERLLRKWQKTLCDTFCHTLYPVYDIFDYLQQEYALNLHNKRHHVHKSMNNKPCLFPSETRPMCLYSHLHKDSLQWLCSYIHIYKHTLFAAIYYVTQMTLALTQNEKKTLRFSTLSEDTIQKWCV